MIALDTFTLITGAFFLLAIFGPAVCLLWFGKSKVRLIKKDLKVISEKSNLSFTRKEIWGDKALCLDHTRKILLYLSHQQGAEARMLIDLTKAINCQAKRSAETILLSIGIRKENRLSEAAISLFDARFDDPAASGFHYMIAKKWMKFIEDAIGNMKVKPLKAA